MRFTLEIPQKDINLSNVAWLAPDPVSNGTALYISKKIRFLDKPRLPLSAGAAFAGLTKLLADNAPKAMKEQKLESYFGHCIAVMSIYHFLVVVGRKGTQMLTNEAGQVTNRRALHCSVLAIHLQGRFYRTIRLLEAGIKPAKKFDFGLCFTEKPIYLANWLCALSEAEAQCAALCKAGKATPRFLRHLMDPSSREVPVMEFQISKILEEITLDMDQFIDLCILSGCDYCVSIRAGMVIFNQQFETERSFATNRFGLAISASAMPLPVYQIPDNWPYTEAQRLFKEPIVSMEEQPEIKWTASNEEGLISSLVNVNGFNIDRMTKIRILFKPAKNLFVPAKRKSCKSMVVCYHAPAACARLLSYNFADVLMVLQSPNLAFKPKTFSTKVSVNSQPRFLGSFKMPTMVLGLRNFKKLLRIFCLPTWI
ncbi:hypothetical protein BT93_G1506 [Corymbia citriodora subsp. variegata]|nr:hypothetical protein BT93_G1506 [Corymbia citriodora subsp. variegata]